MKTVKNVNYISYAFVAVVFQTQIMSGKNNKIDRMHKWFVLNVYRRIIWKLWRNKEL